MANDFSTGKSIFVLAIVAGCFAVLWPNVFYPMIQGTFSQKDVLSSTQGCCDVMFDSDVNAIKVMTEICERILARQADFDSKLIFAFQQGKITKDIVNRCQKTVFEMCGIDITQFLKDKVRLGRNYKQMLDEIRSLNSSLCLKHSFGVSLGEIGLPRLIRVWGINKPKHLRQERPPHLRPEFLHPALREKGRAIPQSNTPAKSGPSESKSGTPHPGMRPPMGGPGQVVPPPKGGGTMGIVMPMYTIGIIVFFLYTMMKLLFKKTETSESYENFTPDPHFQKTVLKENYSGIQEISEDGSKIVITAISGLVEEVNRQLRSDQAQQIDNNKPEEKDVGDSLSEKQSYIEENEEENTFNRSKDNECEEEIVEETYINEESSDDNKSAIKVLGMETTESCEHGAKWSRPPTPLSRPSTPLSRPSTPMSRPSTPQNIFIAGSLPSKSQLLVSDSHIETVPHQDNAVVLTGKVTLSLIGLSENNAEEAKVQDSNRESSLKNLDSNGSITGTPCNDLKVENPDSSKLEIEEITEANQSGGQ